MIKNNSLKVPNQKGGASIISVVIFATIITVILSVYTTIALNLQREAINYDTSTRAFYAATSGYEDTRRAIANDPELLNKDECKPKNSDSNNEVVIGSQGEASYTCQLIRTQPDALEGKIPKDTAMVFPLIPQGRNLFGPNPKTLTITWESIADTNRGSRNDFTPETGWGSAPAMLRVMFFWTKGKGQLGSRDNTQNKSYFLNPANSNGSSPEINLVGDGGIKADDPRLNTNCTPNQSMQVCTTQFSLSNYQGGDHVMFVALRPIYKDANVKLTFDDGTAFDGGQTSVDITGKSGRTFRRVVQNFPSGEYPVKTSYLPDYSLVSGERLCKQFSIANGAYDQGSCNW